MNKQLKSIFDFIEKAEHLSAEEKAALTKAAKEADNALTISEFKLERTEKVKRTTAILLEETIEELEQKRKAVEAHNRELEIEAALEKVRSRTMAMQHSDELGEVSFLLDSQVRVLGIKTRGCAFNIYGENESTEWFSSEMGTMPRYKTPRKKIFLRYYEAGQKGELLLIEEFTGKACVAHYEYLCTLPVMGKALKQMIADGGSFPEQQIDHVAYFKYGYLFFITLEPCPQAHDIFKRFAKVFEQTYTRFLDLQKAEAQAREAEIELALERVRASTMAMHNSSELAEVAVLLFEQIKHLGAETFSSGFNIWDNEHKNLISWMSNATGNINPPFEMPIKEYDHHRKIFATWKKQESFLEDDIKGKELTKHYKYLRSFPLLDASFTQAEEAGIRIPDRQVHNIVFFSNGYLLFITQEPTPQYHSIFQRFGKVFDQTYTRFLDLQKAEAQTREARINLAVERVRAKALAMHKSEEIMKVVAELKEEVMALDIPDVIAATIFLNEGDDKVRMWDLSSLEKDNNGYEIPFDITFKLKKTDPHLYVKRVWENQENYFLEKQQAKDFKRIIAWLRENDKTQVADEVEAFIDETQLQCLHHVVKKLNNGKLVIDLLNPPSEEMESILTKMGAAFDLAYKRFEDLRKAEVQVREAQIEAALERVRSKTMAMHKSDELLEIIIVVSEQLQILNFKFNNVSFGVNNEEYDMHLWMAVKGYLRAYQISWTYLDNPGINRLKEAQKQKLDFFADTLTQDENTEWLLHVFNCNPHVEFFSEEAKAYLMNCNGYSRSVAIMKDIFLVIGNYAAIPYSSQENAILRRFASVFEQSYTRFLDLQKAETQTREAQVEAALERVRSRSMAMHKSEEMLSVIEVVAEQLTALNLNFDTVSFGKNNQQGNFKFWLTSTGQPKPLLIEVPPLDSPVLHTVKEAQKNGINFIADVFTPQENKKWSRHLIKYSDLKYFPEAKQKFILNAPGFARSSFLLKNIDLYLGNYRAVPFTKEENSIFGRFAQVFEQSYTRFLDLQKAEAQAKEAIKQASLDRVRGEIASMRSTEDLQRITPLVFNELTTLGVPFIRCGVFIIQEAKENVEVYLSAPDGHSLGMLNLGFDSNELTTNSVDYWRKGKVFHQHWNQVDFIEWTKSMMKMGQVQNQKTYQGADVAPESLDLHFIPFTQGMLYVGNVNLLMEDEIDLVKSLAKAFAMAYARYEDFVKLEHAKQNIENTLTELKATQKQLVQSEKMASLGELTAGIAHEIQNPLNFVNNFSEVSKELLAEMLEELKNGDTEEANHIADDIIQNLDKILHHGKRADAIVKGMLQHSRSSSGTKEPTDINALCDEYLRLAFHGLRAKDKSFNATMETDFDASLKKIDVVPQDIGRVVLNLITNAFYAVSKSPQPPGGGLSMPNKNPTVWVSTKQISSLRGDKGGIQISVKDNGPGIPKEILDKIFQPFFTTKPTGQGTGLGLSMSYDIVKAHGGEIKVETKEGEGSEFVINLPTV